MQFFFELISHISFHEFAKKILPSHLLIKAMSKGGFNSEDTGGFLRLQKNIPNHYPEQKIWISCQSSTQIVQIFCPG